MIIEGALSVKAALKYSKRDINHVYLPKAKHTRDIQYIRHLCYKNDIEFSLHEREELKNLASGLTHGGVLADVSYRKNDPLNVQSNDILIVEGIEDPYNMGMVIRTALAANFKSIITNYREYHDSEAIILKASAGASEAINWTASKDINQEIEILKTKKIPIISALRSDKSTEYDVFTYPDQLCLCIGGEKRGLSKSVISASDAFIHILYDRDVKVALTSVAATAVLTFEIVRQRKVRQ